MSLAIVAARNQKTKITGRTKRTRIRIHLLTLRTDKREGNLERNGSTARNPIFNSLRDGEPAQIVKQGGGCKVLCKML